MFAEPLGYYIFTEHAEREMARRGLSHDMVRAVLAGPEQRVEGRADRIVFQSRVLWGIKMHLIRVIADVRHEPARIVTVYHTSAVGRYWKVDE